jgi:hypothetical protein
MRVYAGVKPFISPKHDVLAEAAQWQLFFTMFAALAIKVQLDGETLQDRLYFDVAIIVLQFLAPTVLVMRYYFSEEMQSAEGFWKGLRNVAHKRLVEPFKTLKVEAEKVVSQSVVSVSTGDSDSDSDSDSGHSSTGSPAASPRSKLRELSHEQQTSEFLRKK